MACPKCGSKKVKSASGKVYGQPAQKSDYKACGECGLHFDIKLRGDRQPDPLDEKE